MSTSTLERLKKFKEISAAYEVLSDDKKRALYDQYGEAGVKSTMSGGSSTYTDQGLKWTEDWSFGTCWELHIKDSRLSL
ncbi:uncharacterized protein LOC133736336 [Rosa rugosa]|uniref:uncharacterized protein LOC133736336 n=1 Tax=Rosa rugosa TaxID=74645 RepID=UPI002B40C519|nr:uncharacterized protein LOC133736336 [Rosa rugosa]